MPFYAYPNEQRNQDEVVYASDVTNQNKLEEYCCPRIGCVGKMGIKCIGNTNRKAHFAIKRNFPHSDFCRIGKERFDSTEYDEYLFEYEDFMRKLTEPQQENNRNVDGEHGHGEGDGNRKPISTVRQLYLQCINMDINQTYNDMRISDILVDSRTKHIYKYYIRGYHLVECYCYRYDATEHVYYAKYWLNDEHTEFLYLELHFPNENVYNKLREKGIFRRDIVVAGLWESRQNSPIHVTINRSKQIYLLP